MLMPEVLLARIVFAGATLASRLEEPLFQRQVFGNGLHHKIGIDDLSLEICRTPYGLQCRRQLSRAHQALLLQRIQKRLGLDKAFAGTFRLAAHQTSTNPPGRQRGRDSRPHHSRSHNDSAQVSHVFLRWIDLSPKTGRIIRTPGDKSKRPMRLLSAPLRSA